MVEIDKTGIVYSFWDSDFSVPRSDYAINKISPEELTMGIIDHYLITRDRHNLMQIIDIDTQVCSSFPEHMINKVVQFDDDTVVLDETNGGVSYL